LSRGFGLLDGERVPAGRAGNVTVQFEMRVVKNRSDDSQPVSFIRFFPDSEESISKVLTVGARMNVEDVFPSFSNSVSAADLGGDFKSESSSCLSEAVSAVWSDRATVDVGGAIFKIITRVGRGTWFSNVGF